MKQGEVIDYWIEKAEQDLSSARDNLSADRLQNAVRDAYFACFHALSSVLLKDGKSFRKHKEVRSVLHRDFIHAKRIKAEWGKHSGTASPIRAAPGPDQQFQQNHRNRRTPQRTAQPNTPETSP